MLLESKMQTDTALEILASPRTVQQKGYECGLKCQASSISSSALPFTSCVTLHTTSKLDVK